MASKFIDKMLSKRLELEQPVIWQPTTYHIKNIPQVLGKGFSS